MKRIRIVPRVDTVLLGFGIALLPVYIFESGGVQPTHIFFAGFAGIRLLQRGFRGTPLTIALLLLFVQALFVESVYAILGGDPAMIIHSIFIFYNFLVVAAIHDYCRDMGLKSLLPGLFVALAIAIASVASSWIDIRGAIGGRLTGTFNNPNQLGYFSVCLLSLSYLLYREELLRYSVAVAMFAASLFLAIMSLSKAAMVSTFIVACLALKPHSSRKGAALWILSVIGVGAVLIVLYQERFFDQYIFAQRLQNMGGESDSSLTSRGYLAFLEGNSLQMFFGLGNDLVDKIVGHEVHSTPGGVLNNYGLLGFTLFTGMVIYWAMEIWRGHGVVALICIVGPAMLYGITHNGSRFTIFWLLVACSTGAVQRRIRNRVMRSSADPLGGRISHASKLST